MTPLVDEAKPTMGFRKWVTTILSTTQVSQNVIILALMFIYRLKKLNPTVKGKAGSEYRLLTVALMLGNKCSYYVLKFGSLSNLEAVLDDNTYTNKTWSEVSGISVTEIHIMEVEFLSNMRYTLYTSDREWESWHRQLGRFWDYFDRASRTPTESRTLTALGAGQVALPSPPASQHASPNFMPMGSNSAVNGVNGVNRLHPMSMPPYLAPSIPPPAPRMPDIDLRPNNRKRSMDENSDEPYAKRPAVSRFHSQYNPVDLPTIPNGLHHNPLADIQPPRLPMPNPTNNSSMMYNGSYANLLPPPATRAMSTVYGQAQRPHPGESNPMPQAMSAGIRIPPMNDPMQSRLPTTLSTTSKSSSPTSLNLTPTTLSPSGYHFQRNSPYRPVRGVNTLLVPPPPASFHNPSQNIDSGNMYYQPLGKPLSERRTGIVPFTAQQPPQHPLQFDHRYPFAPANHY